MDETVKTFLLDKSNPIILYEFYEDVYNYYYLHTLIKQNKKPVRKNKFSRSIKVWGFKTDVCRDYCDNGKCKRIIVLPLNILFFITKKMRNVTKNVVFSGEIDVK